MLRHREVDDAAGMVSAAGDGERGVETIQLLPQTVGEELGTDCVLK